MEKGGAFVDRRVTPWGFAGYSRGTAILYLIEYHITTDCCTHLASSGTASVLAGWVGVWGCAYSIAVLSPSHRTSFLYSFI